MFRSGFEPLTQGFSVLCSNQLSYLNKKGYTMQEENSFGELVEKKLTLEQHRLILQCSNISKVTAEKPQ